MLKDEGEIQGIFWTVTATSLSALVLTMILIPAYNGATLEASEALAADGKTKAAVHMLFSGPRDSSIQSSEDGMGSDNTTTEVDSDED
eukprot:CAMPEP_0198546828 /NCGR_PEP_ID=MMETSP1462-20131121/67225_1 /TAXON_ID=1333877 /ORGANISM="Brandtodinium nutriculum, Strain RCC3387" /LENGTH=87 /DNA_ID=CAMNT_0044277289 /DNA_START=39 /DNA_END=302 /DNA_ORIENTATION=-